MATSKLKSTKKQIEEFELVTARANAISALKAAGIPLTPEQASSFLQWSVETLNVKRCSRAQAEELGQPITVKHGPKFVMVGSSPRYLMSDLAAFIEMGVRKEVSVDVGRPRKNGRAA